MENDDRMKLTGRISDFSVWDETIFDLAEKFHDKYNVYPNILLASNFTYRKIDLYAQMHPERIVIYDDDGSYETIKTSSEPYEGLTCIVAGDCELACCLDVDLSDGNFTIVFDENPDFGGEPLPKTGAAEQVCKLKRTA